MANGLKLEGQRFGHLTVLKKLDERENRYVVWLCRCDCGNEIKVNTRHLMRGTVKDCGCIPENSSRRGPVAEDLTGRRFGKLVAVKKLESKNGRTRWECRCDCGNMHISTAHSLKAGKCTSCGCGHYVRGRGITDISGQRFGRLTALYHTDKRSKKGSVFWHCRCDCGNEVDVTEDGLLHGNYRSCGCLRQEIWKELPGQLHMVDGTCVEMLEKRKHRSDNTSGFRGRLSAAEWKIPCYHRIQGETILYRNFCGLSGCGPGAPGSGKYYPRGLCPCLVQLEPAGRKRSRLGQK